MTRSDPGTENGLLATCQAYLRQYCGDNLAGEKSHVCGSSLQNQVNYLHHNIAMCHVSMAMCQIFLSAQWIIKIGSYGLLFYFLMDVDH